MPSFKKRALNFCSSELSIVQQFRAGGGAPHARLRVLNSMLGATREHKVDQRVFALKELPVYNRLSLYFHQFLPSLKVLVQC